MWQGHLLSHKLSSKKVGKDRENKNNTEKEKRHGEKSASRVNSFLFPSFKYILKTCLHSCLWLLWYIPISSPKIFICILQRVLTNSTPLFLLHNLSKAQFLLYHVP